MVDLFEFSVNIIEGFIVLLFLTLYFGCKFTGWKKYAGFLLVWLIEIITVTYFNTIYVYEGILGLTFVLIYFLYSLIFLKGNVYSKIFISSFINSIVYIIALITTLFVSLLSDNEQNYLYNLSAITYERIMIVVISKILLISACAVFIRFKYEYIQKKKGMLILIVMPIVAEISTVEIGNLFIINGDTNYRLFLISLSIMIADILIYYVFVKINMAIKAETEFNAMQQKYEYDKQHLRDIEELYSKTYGLRHDLLNHFITLSGLLDSNEKATEYINSVIETSLDISKSFVKTDNESFDAIVNAKIAMCDSMGIKVQTRIMNGALDKLKDYEIGIIFGNLFDNAIEASKNSQKKTIELDVQVQGSYLSIFMKNSIDNPVLKNNRSLKTTKENKMYHGFGTKNINKIINNYNGIINYFEENGYFCCDILI